MKNFILVLSLIAPTFFASAAGLQIGDDLETTIEKQGKPIGTIELREKTLLLFPEGEVTLKDDTVVDFDLMTEEEFVAEQERLEREREQWQTEQAILQAAHTKEGESILADKRSSAAFAALPAKDKVDYWRNFQIRYPTVDVSEELVRALESYQSELEELKTQQRIAQLEARVAQAEKEATAARLETEKMKDEARRTRESTQYGLRYYYDPVVRPRYVYRPPTVTIYSTNNGKHRKHREPDCRYPRPKNSTGTTERIAKLLPGPSAQQ